VPGRRSQSRLVSPNAEGCGGPGATTEANAGRLILISGSGTCVSVPATRRVSVRTLPAHPNPTRPPPASSAGLQPP
jgi:hypothetical protein